MAHGTMYTLQKMTKTKLVEEAHKYPDIVGAHGLSKEEIIEQISAAMKADGSFVEGEEMSRKKKIKKVWDKTAMKKEVSELKKKYQGLTDQVARERARAKINRIKGRLRRLRKVAV